VVTNDGNAILREIDIAHPAAKVCGTLDVFSLLSTTDEIISLMC
jgi:chaperonin GroEL (HSP60 family)